MKLRVSEAQLDWTEESQEFNEFEQLGVQSAVMLSMNQSLSICSIYCQLIHTRNKSEKRSLQSLSTPSAALDMLFSSQSIVALLE